jgi:hypothetical protein
MPFTFTRLREDGFHLAARKKHCDRCGMWLYCFVKGTKRRWMNAIERDGEQIFQDHDIWICDGRRGRRKPHEPPA